MKSEEKTVSSLSPLSVIFEIIKQHRDEQQLQDTKDKGAEFEGEHKNDVSLNTHTHSKLTFSLKTYHTQSRKRQIGSTGKRGDVVQAVEVLLVNGLSTRTIFLCDTENV